MGTTNSLGDFIRAAFSGAVNKTGKVFRALLADPDAEDGTLEKLFSDMETERQKWIKPSLYEQTGQQFAMSMNSFSVLRKELGESEEMFKARNRAVFARGDNITVWGTRYDVLQTMKKVLNSDEVYLVNNCDSYSESLLENGDFSASEGWDLDDAEYDTTEKFMGSKSMKLEEGASCSQSVSLEPGTYFLHFFVKGNVSLQLQNEDGEFWDDESKGWISDSVEMSFSSAGWDNRSVYFFVNNEEKEVTVTFKGEEGDGHIDYTRLCRKDATSTFAVICIFNANTESVITLSPGTDDPDSRIDYNKAAYYSQAYVQGGTAKANTSMYNEVLNNISAGGVNAVLEILNKE